MKLGYFGNILVKDTCIEVTVDNIISLCGQRDIRTLVCTGGISDRYSTSIRFINAMSNACRNNKINFGFIVGNTDLYYNKDDSEASKSEKVRKILDMYRKHENYLPAHPIFLKGARVCGFETWYDYSLYRGSPVDLKDITKKSKFCGVFRNKDVDYITDKSDYMSGIEGTYDRVYTDSTLSRMSSRLDSYNQRWGRAKYNIAVMYFLPSKAFLGNSYLERYFGTFKGSVRYMKVLKEYGVTDCLIGIKCRKDYPRNLNNMRFWCSTPELMDMELR